MVLSNPTRLVQWIPPSENWIKLNTDASASLQATGGACFVILRAIGFKGLWSSYDIVMYMR